MTTYVEYLVIAQWTIRVYMIKLNTGGKTSHIWDDTIKPAVENDNY